MGKYQRYFQRLKFRVDKNGSSDHVGDAYLCSSHCGGESVARLLATGNVERDRLSTRINLEQKDISTSSDLVPSCPGL